MEQLIPSKEGSILSTAYKDRFVFREGDIRAWANQGDVNAMVLHYWQHAWLPLTNVDLSARTAYFKWGTVMPLVHSHPSHGVADWIKQETPYPHQTWYLGASYYMDNVFEELREPGQWYLDRPTGKLYYIPLPGEIAASLDAWAPRLTNYFSFQGDWRKGAYLTGLTIEGISFRHSEFDHQAHRGTGNWWGNYGPSLLIFSGTRQVAVRDCVFESLGECGIDLAYGNAEVELSGNRFRDLGSGAIKAVGSWREKDPRGERAGAPHAAPGDRQRHLGLRTGVPRVGGAHRGNGRALGARPQPHHRWLLYRHQLQRRLDGQRRRLPHVRYAHRQ